MSDRVPLAIYPQDTALKQGKHPEVHIWACLTGVCPPSHLALPPLPNSVDLETSTLLLASSSGFFPQACREASDEGMRAAILQLSQYCTFRTDSSSTVITEPGQPGTHCRRPVAHPFVPCKRKRPSIVRWEGKGTGHMKGTHFMRWGWCFGKTEN